VLLNNTEGINNTAIGIETLFNNITGNANTAIGFFALSGNNAGGGNTALGSIALAGNTTGDTNTAIGRGSLINNTSGSNNVALGNEAGGNVSTANNVIVIGTGFFGENVSNSCYIANIFGTTSSGGTSVVINSSGRLGTMTSSARFKDGIKPMDQTSEELYALRPVTFHYKKEIDPQGLPQFGLVAEEVENLDSDLVVRDKEGKAYSVRYDQVNAMLLNEFLKEHRKVQRLEAALEGVSERLKEQETKMEKVCSQIDSNKPASQVVVSNP